MYGLTQTTAPTGEPVAIEDAKRQCRLALDSSHMDVVLFGYIAAARAWAERYMNRQLLTATWDYQIDRFPASGYRLLLPRSPLRSVSSITYLDSQGVSTVLSSALYRVITSKEPGEVTEAYGQLWPETYGVSGPITIRYSAGYGTAADVPQTIKQAILLKVQEMFLIANGEDSKGYGQAAVNLLGLYLPGDEFANYAESA